MRPAYRLLSRERPVLEKPSRVAHRPKSPFAGPKTCTSETLNILLHGEDLTVSRQGAANAPLKEAALRGVYA
jgi:hypothetical protein